MSRFLFRSFYMARNSSARVFESSVLPAKCYKAAVYGVANECGVKAISTSSVRLCEKNDNVVPSNRDEKTNADEKAAPTESPTLATQKAEDDSKVLQMAEQRKEPVVLKTDDGSTAQQQMDVKIKPKQKRPKQAKTDAPNSMKKDLLDLLGAMKVEVTNKRNRKGLKSKETSTSKLKPDVMERTINMFQKATENVSSQSGTLDPKLVAAASAAASTLPDHSDAESKLLTQLKKQEAVTEAMKSADINNLGVIIAEMKVEKNSKREKDSVGDHLSFDVKRREFKIFGWKRLNIFSPTTHEDKVESVAPPTLWDMDFANQLSLSIDQTPRNGFEEMIQWTKEGKMWHYPINNEAGLEEEASVPFHEHIFLEKHLHEGFPSKGPVRHFMELVLVGLSRNPYLTVEQKKEHIFWFRDYFDQKEDFLKEAEDYNN